MYWRSRNLSALYVWLFGPFTPVNSRVTRGDTVQQAIEKMQGQLDAAGVGLDDTVTEESSNAVKSSGIWTWVKGLFTTHATEADAHPATAISVDTSEFGGNLDETVNTVQKLATAVDELEASPVITEPLTPSNDAVAVGDGFQKIGEKVAGLQLQSGGKVNALGSITGANEIDLTNGTFVTATLTGAVELSFTGLPTAGYVKDFVLLFTNIETIAFPVGTKFAGGVPPVVIASPYMFVCSVDSAGVLTVYSLIDNIIVPV